MAIITVSDIGGSFFDPATWVGGVMPGLYDSVAFTPTSGNLEVDGYVTNNILGIDFTNFTGEFKMSGLVPALNIENNGVISSFINFGTGGYTLTDASGGIATIQIFSNTDCIITNTINKINPFRLFFTSMSITGTWQQQGLLEDGGSYLITSINDGIFHLLGTQNLLNDWGNTSNEAGGVYFNGDMTFLSVYFDGGDFKLIGGNFNCPTAGFYSVSDNIKINFNNHTFETIDIGGGIINNIQLDSTLLANNLDISTKANFTGNFGFNVNTFTGYDEIIFKSTIEYFVNNQISMRDCIISSSTPGNKAKLTLGQNIDQLLVLNVTATDIDSSNGRRVNNFYGTATNCDNWKIWNDNTLPQVTSTF
jgi:hypothetical protein